MLLEVPFAAARTVRGLTDADFQFFGKKQIFNFLAKITWCTLYIADKSSKNYLVYIVYSR